MRYAWSMVVMTVVGIAATGCAPNNDSGVAGVAYSENDAGELVQLDGTRSTSSTPIPAMSANKSADAEWYTSFELTERSGAIVRSEELKGQPYVVSFFFSKCPSICVRQNEKVQLLQEKFSGQPIRLVSITCDPVNDTPEVLAEYAKQFNADPEQWLFLTGDIAYLRRVGAEMFSLPVDVGFHAEKFVLMNAQGEIHAAYNWNEPEQWQQLQLDMAELAEQSSDKT